MSEAVVYVDGKVMGNLVNLSVNTIDVQEKFETVAFYLSDFASKTMQIEMPLNHFALAVLGKLCGAALGRPPCKRSKRRYCR